MKLCARKKNDRAVSGKMNFKRVIRLKNGAAIFVRPLGIKDIIPLHKMYLSLSGDSKLLFHPYLFQPKSGWLWIRAEIPTILSCFSVFRKIFLRIFPKAVYLSLIGLNSRQEIVAFTFLRIMKRVLGGGYAAEAGIVVRDDYQNKGLGSQLIVCRNDFASGILKLRELYAFVLTENLRVIHINQKLGYRIIRTIEKRDAWKNEYYSMHEMVLHLEKNDL